MADKNLFSKYLDLSKLNEKPEALLIIADNAEYIRLLVAWTNINIKRVESCSALKGESENIIWVWLWENVIYSKQELIDILGSPTSELALESKLKLLIGNHIIYPDGTLNSYVQRYLREQVLKLFGTKTNPNNKTYKKTGK